jgi:alanine racemase
MQHNLRVARGRAPHSKIWAIVKANGYGHGLERAMAGFAEADGLALIEIADAVLLRKLGWIKPILLLQGAFKVQDLALIVAHQLHTVVHCDEQIDMLEHLPAGAKVDVYVKMNTGMNRLGMLPEHALAAHQRLRALASVRSVSMMTHFANSFSFRGPHRGITVGEQTQRFYAIARELECEVSLADSATVLVNQETAADWVRPGIMLYGATVFSLKRASDFELLPAMTLSSEIIGIQRIEAGNTVGYGGRFVAVQPMTIGVVACGYTDGYPRSAPDGTPVLVDGIKTGIVGRVSMDSVTVDLTPVPLARLGSKVTLWGQGLPVEEVANAAGTIGCELMCGLSHRVVTVDE